MPIAALAKITHATFQAFLARQPWPAWAVNTAELAPLVPYRPVRLATLMRVVKSHYIFSDMYVFRPASSEADVAAIDWRSIPVIEAEALERYVIATASAQPFLGWAGSLDQAQRGQVVLLLPADAAA